MKQLKWILLSGLILLGLMPLYGQGFNGSINYQDFSKSELILGELVEIPKIQLAGEYWYFEAKRLKKADEFKTIQLAQADLRDIKRLEQIKYWQNTAEENKPSIFQHPIAITIYIGFAFATGLAIGL